MNMTPDTISNTDVVTFKTISKFVACMKNFYNDTYNEIILYHFLLDKTTFSHEKCIKKHVHIFKEFMVGNRAGIIKKDFNLFETDIVRYSDKVFLNMREIMRNAADDHDTSEVLWKHLLTLSALLDPTGEARNILKQTSKQGSGDGKENNFITSILDKIDTNIDFTSSNPMDSIGSILSSGVVSDIMSNIGGESDLDIGSVFGIVQKMLSGMNNSPGDDSAPAFDLSSILGSLQPKSEDGSAPPPLDLSAILGSLQPKSEDGSAPPPLDLSAILGSLQPKSEDGSAPPPLDLSSILGSLQPKSEDGSAPLDLPPTPPKSEEGSATLDLSSILGSPPPRSEEGIDPPPLDLSAV